MTTITTQAAAQANAPGMPTVADTAVLLVNLGTPDAPTAAAVRRYLAEFLHDYRVVPLSRWIWCPLLHFIILPIRGPKVAKKYAEVWMEGGSPLAVHTRGLAAAMQPHLPGMRVEWAMRYGNPSMSEVVGRLRKEGMRKIVVLPLYPQYSTTTTASVADKVAVLRDDGGPGEREFPPEFVFIDDYHIDRAWVSAVADSIRRHWQRNGRGERLLFSFHGIPQRLVDAGDPYAAQCRAGAEAIVAELGLVPEQWLLTYQSRFGREPWLQPYTDKTLESLPAQGVKTLDVVCPGFAVDCLETLEEISLQNAELFREHGGEALHYIPCLNSDDAHAQALSARVLRALNEHAAEGHAVEGHAVKEHAVDELAIDGSRP
jgi:protoporphyrin/coproporphyrin ferrochelatase